MKSCLNCKYAKWDKTKSGNLHPSGDGLCFYPFAIPKLPASMYWIGKVPPYPCGGSISRKTELKEHCVYFSVKPSEKEKHHGI